MDKNVTLDEDVATDERTYWHFRLMYTYEVIMPSSQPIILGSLSSFTLMLAMAAVSSLVLYDIIIIIIFFSHFFSKRRMLNSVN